MAMYSPIWSYGESKLLTGTSTENTNVWSYGENIFYGDLPLASSSSSSESSSSSSDSSSSSESSSSSSSWHPVVQDEEGKVFAGQSNLRIQLTMLSDLTDYTVAKIKYQKPDGTEGEWIASVYDRPNGIIYYDLQDGDIATSEYGEWLFWAWASFTDGRATMGEQIRRKFWREPS